MGTYIMALTVAVKTDVEWHSMSDGGDIVGHRLSFWFRECFRSGVHDTAGITR